MNNVPNMISTKDLDYIKDMLNWNLVIVKKANHYMNEVQDAEVKAAFDEVKKMHSTHFKSLLKILQ